MTHAGQLLERISDRAPDLVLVVAIALTVMVGMQLLLTSTRRMTKVWPGYMWGALIAWAFWVVIR